MSGYVDNSFETAFVPRLVLRYTCRYFSEPF